MKLITRDTDYAIRALSCIAGESTSTVSVTALTEVLEIPRPFLRKILQELNKKGILRSIKGKGGGFSMGKSPSEITVYELIEIFQGPFELSEHIFKGSTCKFLNRCELKKKLDKIQDKVSADLKNITIASLIDMHGPH